jgi:TolB-like protein
MNKQFIKTFCLGLLISLYFAAFSWAGQVVTNDVKLWAKKAIEQENALETASASNTLAVLYFNNKTKKSKLDLIEKGLALMLMTDLSKVENIQIVERVKLQALKEELKLANSKLADPATSSRMGKLLGAKHLLGGNILKEKIGHSRFASNLLKVPTEKIIGQPEAEGKLISDLLIMEKNLLNEIIKLLEIELSSAQAVELKKHLSENTKALIHLFRAINYSDRRDYERAYKFYKKALKEDPNLLLAQEAIDELFALKLIGKDAPVAEGYSRGNLIDKFDLKTGPVDDKNYNPERDPDPDPDPEDDEGTVRFTFTFEQEDEEENATKTVSTNKNIVKGTFLPYAIEKSITDMDHGTTRNRDALSAIQSALGHADIRRQDAWLTKVADAKSGRVLKDINGNWVRTEQYILRPDSNTVQLLNICLRIDGSDRLNLSTIDWQTTFTEGFSGSLKNLPWDRWLDTRTDDNGRYVTTSLNAPELEDMYVRFTNSGNEYLEESRAFAPRTDMESYAGQYINDDHLTMMSQSTETPLTYSMQEGQYQIVMDNSGGFNYVTADGTGDINVSFSVLGNSDNTVEVKFKDIWDALRVNEKGAQMIGNGALEIGIDANKDFFTQSIDVIYIPMSSMEWKSDGTI